MAEAIVSTLKAKIKANDEELQMFQDKWEIVINTIIVLGITITTIITAINICINKWRVQCPRTFFIAIVIATIVFDTNIVTILPRCEDTRAQLNTEIKEREEAEAEVDLSFIGEFLVANTFFFNCCKPKTKEESEVDFLQYLS